ncbi:NADH dehydrogenase [ubiquinone] 1 alpha subcomplex subunit 9, mitochondrial [Frankliniella fusca]|uniref:NADH dehydrogenase [ubiquinone] 1 alpha subcomplex subunit 9, mitochondrial n=2 Tax=Arthropoda TaxID=6656 RepID=A0AAE1LX47_9NEOP|nr:NADH dehydrogenase [ubiquinone] 1 alpha subcomplex subunit 9, mitochondrial [Frankliniella fusca]
MAAVVLQGSLHLSKQQLGASAAVVNIIHHASYSSEVRPIKKPALSQMRKGAGGRSSFNGVVATVFGATGFIGRYVCNELGKHGTQLILPYRGDNYEVGPLKLVGDLGQVLFHPFDLRDEESIRKAVKYSNVVINLIGRDWETKNFKFEDVNVHGARRLARISKEMGVEKFIHLSALNVTPKPVPKMLWNGSGVLRSKYYGEIAVREEFPDAVVLRPALTYGMEDRWLMQHCAMFRPNGKTFPLYKKGFGITKMPIYVNDVAAAIYEVIKNPDTAGRTYQLIGPHRYVLHDLMVWIMNEQRKGADENFRVTDLRFDPLQITKILLAEMLPGHPIHNLHREIMELEATTDVVDYSLPTVVDLGIKPSPMEENITWLLRPFKHRPYISPEVGDFDKVIPPKPVI